jgi:tRNA (guanosine-2'-O-)-methyltransferase
MPTERRIEKFRRVLQHRQPDLTVVCENVHDPHNVSAILRSCDSVGVCAVQLLYTVEEFPSLARKSSGSARKWVDPRRFDSAETMARTLRSEGFTLYATHLEAEAVPIYDVDFTRPSAIIVGNEHRGVSDEVLALSDQNIYIPQTGMIESLNVSVATAVILYEAFRQRSAAGMVPHPEGVDLEATLEEWLER